VGWAGGHAWKCPLSAQLAWVATGVSRLVPSNPFMSAGCQWLTPVILAPQEERSGGWRLEASPGQIVCETLSRKKPFTK
jgi:hypothetical protein